MPNPPTVDKKSKTLRSGSIKKVLTFPLLSKESAKPKKSTYKNKN